MTTICMLNADGVSHGHRYAFWGSCHLEVRELFQVWGIFRVKFVRKKYLMQKILLNSTVKFRKLL